MISTSTTQRGNLAAFSAAALSLAAALVYYRPWVLHPGIPFEFASDALQKLELATAAVRNGWFFHIPGIGLPGVGQHLDFPRFDSLNYLAIKLLAWCCGDVITAANVYFLLGYPFVAFAAGWVLQRLGVSPCWSFVGAVAYAWFPYHQLRGFIHFTNAAYMFVPFAFLFLRRVWYPADGASAWSARTWAAWLGYGVVLELQNPYYAVFFSVLALSIAVLLGAARGLRLSRRALLQTGAVVAVVALAFVGEQLPRWLFEAEHGKNALAVVRTPAGILEYSLSLADLLNPSPDHPLHFLANWTQRAAAIRGIKYNERVVATFPLIGVAGLCIGVWRLLWRAKRLSAGDERARLQQWAGALMLVALAWCHEGALSTLLAETGFGLIRAWNRMSIFIAFAAIVAAVSLLDGLSERWSPRVRRGALGIVLLLVLAEQLFAKPRMSFATASARFNEAKQLTSAIATDGALHRAFIVPYIDYPEAGKIGNIRDYDHLMFTIASPQIATSYGSMRGRGASYFASAAQGLHGAELSSYLRDAGFDTIIVDTFASDTAPLQAEIASALGMPIAQTARFLAYRIAKSSPRLPPESAWRSYALGMPLNFRDVANRRFLELNFSTFEAEGTWTAGPLAALRLSTTALPPALVLTLEGDLFEDPLKKQSVRVLFDGQPICTLDRSMFGGSASHRWSCPFKPSAASSAAVTHEVRFEIDHPVSPEALKQGPDPRLLGLRLMSLVLDADDASN